MTKSCFIISSIGKENSETRVLANEKFELIFEPVLKESGYTVTRADKIGAPGSISREIVSNVINSDLVIADVTDENPNVFYELAIRNAAKKPVIIFRGVNQPMPFDIYDKRAIDIDRNQPRIWDNAKKALKTHIRESEKKPELASESILTTFTFQLDTEKRPNNTDEMYYILKDLQQQISKIPKHSTSVYVSPQERKIKIAKESIQKLRFVNITPGSAIPGCEEKNDCFDPPVLEMKLGETVLWLNEDTAAHTVTSGTPDDGSSGDFDSGLFMAGNTFSHIFEESGEFYYYDRVHPWMIGTIIVK